MNRPDLGEVAHQLTESIGSLLAAYLVHVGAKRFLADEIIVVLSDDGRLSLTCVISEAERRAGANGDAWVSIKDLPRYVEMAAAVKEDRLFPPPLLDPTFFSLAVQCTEALMEAIRLR